ncbi:MAG: hypothetical protein KME31_34565 [Tolypothrix carrinoi HA7290-LM1]|nr:hypothetical protein [Tolypothrix carrinoi HA7290-LM1]
MEWQDKEVGETRGTRGTRETRGTRGTPGKNFSLVFPISLVFLLLLPPHPLPRSNGKS